MNAVVSRFGLKAEGPVRVRVGDPTESLVLAPVCQSDLVAALLLHALRQATDGDLTTDTEPMWDQQEFKQRVGEKTTSAWLMKQHLIIF